MYSEVDITSVSWWQWNRLTATEKPEMSKPESEKDEQYDLDNARHYFARDIGTYVNWMRMCNALNCGFVQGRIWGLKADREARGPGAVREAFEKGATFIVSTLQESGVAIDKAAISALLEHAGTDIAALRNVVEQLAIYASARGRVTLEDVHALARGAAVVNDWALTDAVAAGNAREALRQLRRQLDEGRSPFQVHGMLGWWVRDKLPALRERQGPAAVEALLRADLDLKSSADPQVVLERFVVELCEVGRRG